MTPELTRVLVVMVAALMLSLGATALFRKLALRIGAVHQPRQDRWSRAPVPLLGGPAIVLTTALLILVMPGTPPNIRVLLAGASALALVGSWTICARSRRTRNWRRNSRPPRPSRHWACAFR